MKHVTLLALAMLLALVPSAFAAAAKPVDLNTPRPFQKPESREQWADRAARIREQAKFSCGLFPETKRSPLRFKVFDRVERDGYSVEKVWIETLPGFHLGGNLYRPLNQGRGPFPGILNPHGHWAKGRLADEPDGSLPARCIHYARNGFVAFSYDMVGYHDTRFSDLSTNRPLYETHRTFGNDPTDSLWNISLLGLQTWNSIRALDFLEALPDVDRHRLACTGESGGGTQTFMLGAVDNRLAAQAPIVMVSHIMQGGCSCENAPGLRVEYSNVDIAAAVAPRPQYLVAATGDWTRHTLEMEGPSIASVYALFGAPKNFGYARFDFGHNYNKTSREAVYHFMGDRFLPQPHPAMDRELPYTVEADLRVFPGELPKGAATRDDLRKRLREDHARAWERLRSDGAAVYRDAMLPAWHCALKVPTTSGSVLRSIKPAPEPVEGFRLATVEVQRPGGDSVISVRRWTPARVKGDWVALVPVAPESSGMPLGGMTRLLLQRGIPVVECPRLAEPAPDLFTNFFAVYNLTPMQKQVRDWVTVAGAARSLDPEHPGYSRIILVGTEADGAVPLLAAPVVDAVVANARGLVPQDEQALLSPLYYAPGLLALGGFEGVALMAAPQPALIHNTGSRWPLKHLKKVSGKRLQIHDASLPDSAIAETIAQWASR